MKILLAEDDFVTRKFMASFLSKYGECDEEKELHALMCGFGVGLSWGGAVVDLRCINAKESSVLI